MSSRAPRQTLEGGLLIAGRYRVERMLGRGGVATVYAVQDELSGQPLALKYVLLDRAGATPRDEQTLALLQREYHTLEQVAHPGIVRVFDFGLVPDGAFYTMELLDGQDLSDAPPLPWTEACKVLREVASALAMLHARRLIHRDVSHRNVRLTTSAGAKLLDFGGMMPMGFALQLIGTAPFMSPEAVHGEPLDHRADLYGLGALAYYLFARQHAYPVRTVTELKAAWAAGDAVPLAELVPELPGPLSRLIMSLLAREPAARPSSMAEVIDALSVLAGLERGEAPDVARAYLINPKLIGAQPLLARLRHGLARALDGRGGALLIEGAFGTGKSRILQELVLSAKLTGASVLQLRAQSARGVAYALARDLMDVIAGQLPQAAELLGPERRAVLGWLLPLTTADAPEPTAATPRPENRQEVRARVQAELLGLLRELGTRTRLVIAVDDVHAADDASVGLLAALASMHGPGTPALVCSVRAGDAGSDALRSLLARAVERVQLRAFGLGETQLLVESLFGASPRSRHVAGWLHEHTQGNPLQCVELARHLVESRAVSYLDGAWSLPDALPDGMPRGLSEAFTARVNALPADAHALAELLALHGAPASLALCGECAGLGQHALFAALDALVAADVVIARGDRYAISRSGIRDVLLHALAPERRRALHQRIGEALEARAPSQPAELLVAAHQLLQGTTPLRGVDLLERALPNGDMLVELGEAVVAPLELALQACEAAGEPPARVLRVRVVLAGCAFLYDTRLLPHVDALIARLRTDSGVEDWTRDEPSPEGLWRSVMRAEQRYQATPAAERGLRPVEALGTFAGTVASTLGVAVLERDFDRIEQLAAVVAPFSTLGKEHALALVYDLVMAVHASTRGYAQEGDALRERLFAQLRDPKMYAGVPFELRKSVLATQLHAMGMRRAAFDEVSALAIADEIDALGLRMYAGAAMQIRMMVELHRGNTRAAAEHGARVEALTLHGGPGRQTELWLLGYLVGAYSALSDVMGIKRTAERLAALAPNSPGYRVSLYCALGAYYRERGQFAEAEALLQRALPLCPLGKNAYYGAVAHELCRTWVSSGQHARAVELADDYYAAVAGPMEEPEVVALRLWPMLAASEVALGRTVQARERLQRLLAYAEATPVPLARRATVHEALARVALGSGDRDGFEQHVARAADCYRAVDNPSLLARLTSWVDEVSRSEGVRSPTLRPADTSSVATVADRPEPSFARLLDAADAGERARRALAFILQQHGVEHGALFLSSADGLRLAAAIGPTRVPATLPDALLAWLDGGEPAHETGTRTESRWLSPDGDAHRVVPLVFSDEHTRHVVGAALLPPDARPASGYATALLAHALYEAGELSISDSVARLLAL